MPHRPLALALLGILTACGGGHPPAAPTPAKPAVYRVLFIGNSLTYTNDLPATVAAVALAAGDTMQVRTVAGPNLALIDHVAGQTDAVDVIKSELWDYVVLQQGPTSLPLYRDTLILATKWLQPYVRAAGARSAQLMVSPMATKRASFDEVRRSSQLAAKSVGGSIPAGGWRPGAPPGQPGRALRCMVLTDFTHPRWAPTSPRSWSMKDSPAMTFGPYPPGPPSGAEAARFEPRPSGCCSR